jgi:DNA-binding LacI/PurR family transcriptional regulator
MEMEDHRCCQIYYDDAAIGREAARQLSIRGHREVLVLAGPGEFAAARERLAGFYQAGQALRLKVLIREGSMNWRGWYDLMSVYLNETPAASRVSAVFTANDWMAAGALQAMVQASVRVPEDMSLIGCDDATLAAELEPPLATFRQDVSRWVEQCFVALEQAWRLKLPGRIVLPAEFVERRSLGTKSHE